jgi:predicted Zn-ribbon and HTH transcriptional regulator
MSNEEYKIVIVRKGECKKCGFCCGFIDGKITEGSCPHLTSL